MIGGKSDRKLTTNEKLNSIINGPEGEDEYEAKLYAKKEKKAKALLQRARLYGCGARAKIPKIQKPKTAKHSPFSVSTLLDNPEKVELPKGIEDSAVPPGSHSDLYRLVFNAKHDPFFTTSSMTEGIRFMHQPPWYFGTNNKIKPSDSSMVAAASRYGYRGARDIMRYSTAPHDPTFRTRNPHTPFVPYGNEDSINEWVPPIIGSPIQTINNMESPKLWPENTKYTSGSMIPNQTPLSPSYRRETTVVEPSKPPQPKSLLKTLKQYEEEVNILKDYGKLESSRVFLSRPMTAQLEFETTWNDRMAKTANSTLRATLSRELLPCQKHGLMDSSDTISSSLGGSMSMIVHSQSSQEFQFRYRIQQHQSNTPYSKRWRLVFRCFLILKSTLKRDQSMSAAVNEMALCLQKQSKKVASGSMIKKADFVAAFRTSRMFEALTDKLLSQLYSVFDHNRKNVIRYVSVIASFVVLDQHTDKSHQLHDHHLLRISKIWDYFAEHCGDQAPIDRALSVITTASGNDDEFVRIKNLFATSFKSICFHLGITADFDQVLRRGITALSLTTSKSGGDSDDDLDDDSEYNAGAVSALQDAESTIESRSYADLPVFSVCGSAGLTREIFISVLASCPELMQETSQQCRSRFEDLSELVEQSL